MWFKLLHYSIFDIQNYHIFLKENIHYIFRTNFDLIDEKWFKSLYYSIPYSQNATVSFWTRLFILYSNQILIWSMKIGIKYFLLSKFELSKSDIRVLKDNIHFRFKPDFILIDENSIEIFELFVVILSKATVSFWTWLLIFYSK
jgi:hypothetical protein